MAHHQVAGGQVSYDIATNKHAAYYSNSPTDSYRPNPIPDSCAGQNSKSSLGLDKSFNDSDFPSPPLDQFSDFILYDSDPPFIDEEASTVPNHGSVYNGYNNQQTSWLPKYSSHDKIHEINPPSPYSSQIVYQPTDHSARPSLFGEYEVRKSSTLQSWAITSQRYESRAVKFSRLVSTTDDWQYDEDIQLTPPSSPTKRGCNSGKSQRRSRH